jgi:hypothetical protein
MLIPEFPIAEALGFSSAMRTMETPVVGIKRLLRHWRFQGVIIEMEWSFRLRKRFIDCKGRRLNLDYGLKDFTTEFFKESNL